VLPDWAPPLDTSIDAGFHIVPAVVTVLDLLFFSPPWTIAALPSIALSTAIAFGYWFWIEMCFAKNGFYPYPIFEMLDTPQRIGLFAGSAAVFATAVAGLKGLYKAANGVHISEDKPRSVPGDVKKRA
jgi:FAR-17a/AIG1-like protein